MKIYLNGKFVNKAQASVSVFDHGFLYGDGAFEGIRSYNRLVFKLKEHIDRLYETAHTLMINIPLTKDQMILVKPTRQYTHISIVNYDGYQLLDHAHKLPKLIAKFDIYTGCGLIE